jgi:hypothetical protein
MARHKRVPHSGMRSTVKAGGASPPCRLLVSGWWCEPLPDGRQQWRADAIAALLATEDAPVLFHPASCSGAGLGQPVLRMGNCSNVPGPK